VSNFLNEAREIQSELEAIRRRIHQEPEIGLDLPKTQAKIVAALEGLGLEVTTGKSLSSVTAVLRGNNSDKTVLLRADMDGDPRQDPAYRATLLSSKLLRVSMHLCNTFSTMVW
jgi:hippurate hydrolase